MKWVDVDSIVVAEWNPIARTGDAALRDLLEKMRREGYLEEHPVIIGSDGVLGDGHRRLACAKLLGLKRIPVIYSRRTSRQIYLDNATQRKQGARDWGSAWAQGLTDLPQPHSVRVKVLVEAVGEERAREICLSGASPEIAVISKNVANYIEKGGQTPPETGEIVEWMLRHGQRRPCLEAMRDGVLPQSLIAAIREDRRLRKWA